MQASSKFLILPLVVIISLIFIYVLYRIQQLETTTDQMSRRMRKLFEDKKSCNGESYLYTATEQDRGRHEDLHDFKNHPDDFKNYHGDFRNYPDDVRNHPEYQRQLAVQERYLREQLNNPSSIEEYNNQPADESKFLEPTDEPNVVLPKENYIPPPPLPVQTPSKVVKNSDDLLNIKVPKKIDMNDMISEIVPKKKRVTKEESSDSETSESSESENEESDTDSDNDQNSSVNNNKANHTETDLRRMKMDKLKKYATSNGVKFNKQVKKPDLIKSILSIKKSN